MKCNRKLGEGRMATKAKSEKKERHVTPESNTSNSFQKTVISFLTFVLSGVVWCAGLAENRKCHGNYKVRYWDPDWQAIIYGNHDSYLAKILSAGFDGVYLDLIDAYEHFEK